MQPDPQAGAGVTNIVLIETSPNLKQEVTDALDGDSKNVHLQELRPDAESVSSVSAGSADIVVVDRRIGAAQVPQLLGRLREITDSPVIVVNVDNRKAEKLSMLEAGADDYVARPLDREALRRRLRAALGYRGRKNTESKIAVEDLEIDFEQRRVLRAGEDVHLTPTEFNLLAELTTRPGGLLTHTQLLRRVWGPAYGTESHYLRVYVAQLRRKLGDDAAHPRLIVTEPGIGYRWIGGLPR
jgi:two-component system KDP operon response regulator KdpE